MFVDKFVNGFLIKLEDGDVFRKFFIILIGCKNIFKEIGYFSKIENFDILKFIVNWLLFGFR